jgi:hypothetical protein
MKRCPCCGDVANKTSILNKKWPTDTWFRRALARKMKADASELEPKSCHACGVLHGIGKCPNDVRKML